MTSMVKQSAFIIPTTTHSCQVLVLCYSSSVARLASLHSE